MRALSEIETVGLEFPDRAVLAFSAGADAVEFTCDGAFLAAHGLVDGRIEVSIRGWAAARVTRFDVDGKNGVELPLDRSGRLDAICECSFTETEVKLAGFEAGSGRWQTYWFDAPQVRARVG